MMKVSMKAAMSCVHDYAGTIVGTHHVIWQLSCKEKCMSAQAHQGNSAMHRRQL